MKLLLTVILATSALSITTHANGVSKVFMTLEKTIKRDLILQNIIQTRTHSLQAIESNQAIIKSFPHKVDDALLARTGVLRSLFSIENETAEFSVRIGTRTATKSDTKILSTLELNGRFSKEQIEDIKNIFYSDTNPVRVSIVDGDFDIVIPINVKNLTDFDYRYAMLMAKVENNTLGLTRAQYSRKALVEPPPIPKLPPPIPQAVK